VISVSARVQYLHRDLAVLRVHGVGDLSMPGGLAARRQLAGERLDPARTVGCVASCDNEADVAARALSEIGSEPIVFVAVFQPRVHGTHEHAVLECREAEIKWRKKMRVVCVVQLASPVSEPLGK